MGVTTMVQMLFQRSKALFIHWCCVGQEEAMVGALQVFHKWVRICMLLFLNQCRLTVPESP